MLTNRPAVPVGLEIDLDVDEEGDLDRDLQAELTLAEKVTDDPAESAQATAGSGEELGELLHDGSPVIAFHRGDEKRIGKECCIGTTAAKRRT